MSCSEFFCIECNIFLREGDTYHRHCPCPFLNGFGNKCNYICDMHHSDERCCPNSCYTNHVHCTIMHNDMPCNRTDYHEHCGHKNLDGSICTDEKTGYHSHCECGNSLEEEDEGYCKEC